MDDLERLGTYLANLEGPDLALSPLWAKLVRWTWAEVERRVPGVLPPSMGPGGESGFWFYWTRFLNDQVDVAVDLEIAADGTYSGYVFRACGGMWDTDGECYREIPEKIIQCLTEEFVEKNK